MLTDWAVSEEANRPVICEYSPDTFWLWTKYSGTVLSLTIAPVLLTMLVSAAVDGGVHALSALSWDFLDLPPASEPLVMRLQGVKTMWEYELTLCTFILTFFTQDAYAHWKSVYFTTRRIQGRINDIAMLLAIGAQRQSRGSDGGGGGATDTQPRDGHGGDGAAGVTVMSEEAASLVRTCSRLVRLSHTFFWAATPTASNGLTSSSTTTTTTPAPQNKLAGSSSPSSASSSSSASSAPGVGLGGDPTTTTAIGPLLLGSRGLRGLVDAGELTEPERRALRTSGLPPSQYSYILMEWAGAHAMGGVQRGTLVGGAGYEQELLKHLTSLRAEYFSIGDLTAGRMPLAYVQLVQVLVDSLVILSPFALYPKLGGLSIPLSGLLCLFFKGLLELSKSFLDPFGNEGYLSQSIHVDVLVSELNFGAQSRWFKAGAVLPPSDVPPSCSSEELCSPDATAVRGP